MVQTIRGESPWWSAVPVYHIPRAAGCHPFTRYYHVIRKKVDQLHAFPPGRRKRKRAWPGWGTAKERDAYHGWHHHYSRHPDPHAAAGQPEQGLYKADDLQHHLDGYDRFHR